MEKQQPVRNKGEGWLMSKPDGSITRIQHSSPEPNRPPQPARKGRRDTRRSGPIPKRQPHILPAPIRARRTHKLNLHTTHSTRATTNAERSLEKTGGETNQHIEPAAMATASPPKTQSTVKKTKPTS